MTYIDDSLAEPCNNDGLHSKFSIIVPVFNVAEFIRPCLDSVLRQSYGNWECICVDDGSSDGSADILDEFGRIDNRFKVIHKSNEGVARARNSGLDCMQADYFLFLDGDDVWHPDLLKTCVRLIDANPGVDVVQFGYRQFETQFDCETISSAELVGRLLTVDGDYKHTLFGFFACNKAYRTKCLGRLRESPYCVGEDLLYLAQVFLSAERFVVVGEPLYGYRVRLDSIMHQYPTPQRAMDSISFKRDIIDVVKKSGRKLSAQTAHWLSNAMTEDFVFDYLTRVTPRAKVRVCWKTIIRNAARCCDLNVGQRIRMLILALFPYPPVTTIMCWIPCWMKRKGLHR